MIQKKTDIIKSLAKHEKDVGSTEVQVGLLSAKIEKLSQHFKKFKNIVKEIYELTKPDNITINLVRGDPKEKVNVNLDIKLYQEAMEYRDSLFYKKKMS